MKLESLSAVLHHSLSAPKLKAVNTHSTFKQITNKKENNIIILIVLAGFTSFLILLVRQNFRPVYLYNFGIFCALAFLAYQNKHSHKYS